MRFRLAIVLFAFALLVVTAAPSVAETPHPGGATTDVARTANGTDLTIVAAYPNPVASGDRGEFIVLSAEQGTRLSRYRLSDDDATVSLPNVTASGRVAVSTAPEATTDVVDHPVYAFDGAIALANGGESLRLTRNGTAVDTLAYVDAPDGELRITSGRSDWRSIGATDRQIVTAGAGRVRAFVLPDAPSVAVEHLRSADRRIRLAGYTLTSQRVGDALIAAAERNVSVRVLVDGNPVGGLSRRQASLLDRLVAAGVSVRALGGDYARYAFHHPKYAVVDDRALVTTENWKPAGVGGTSSRGWGVVTNQSRIVGGLVETFAADARWRGAVPWSTFRTGESFVASNRTNGSFARRFEPAAVPVDRTRLLVAPDNAESGIVEIIDNATESIAVEQVGIGSRRHPFLRATLDAARRGVRVRILLSSAWYAREENQRLVEWLNDLAERENLPLDARLVDPRGRFEKVHAKGLIVDNETVVVGSVNWNNNSVRENREVALALDGEAVGRYYRRVFESDWPSPPSVPAGLLVALVVAVAFATRTAMAIDFEN